MERNQNVSAPGCCSEYEALSRRELLDFTLRLPAVLGAPLALPRLAFSGGGGTDRDLLVSVFLRGGMDGLTTCVPYADPALYAARPSLAIAPPGSGPESALDLDGFFGLAPAAAPLLTPYQAGHLAVVHAAGSPDPTRSHFDAKAYMEFGIPNQPINTVSNGWLARHLLTVSPSTMSPLRGMAITGTLPQTLQGAPSTLPIPAPNHFDFPGQPDTAAGRRAVIEDTYADLGGELGEVAASTMATIDLLAGVDFEGHVPQNGAVYPSGAFGDAFKNLSVVIAADLGLECAHVDLGGWDLHTSLGPLDGGMASLLDKLTKTLEAFYLDNLAGIDRIVVVVLSEFGRRVAENASEGLDHGHGNCILAMGGGINGGQVLHQWPGLAPADLTPEGDLQITTDYRDVLAEILSHRLDNQSLDEVFPNYLPTFPGITI